MMQESSYIEISEIMDSFDLDEVRKLIHDQIEMLYEETCENLIDNFKILYSKYASIREEKDNMDEDDFQFTENRFYKICAIFIDEVCEKYGLHLNDDYLEEHYSDTPKIALCLYRFFVIDFKSNLYHILLHYINENQTMISEAFDSAKLKRDASTMANKNIDNEDVSLIVSNIYDIAEWILDQINEDIYLDSVSSEYLLLDQIKYLFENGILVGEFTDEIRNILQNNIALKGRICFDLICKLKGVI